MTDELRHLLSEVATREPADRAALDALAVESGVSLPKDYLAFMASSDGGEGDVGETWIETVASRTHPPNAQV